MEPQPIDVRHLGRERVICCWRAGDFIVDPGPAVSLSALVEALGEWRPRGILLTHIHLDHAGATGALARLWPEVEVHVHQRGAPHLADPQALLASAGRIYGDDLERLWGRLEPVPGDRLRPLRGGERIDGFEVAYTPGHASHHVCYLSEDGEAFVGDVAGVRIPPGEHTIAPTPPPDIDVEAWLDSLATVAAWNPETLCLTHFGPVTEVEDHLHRVRTALLEQADLARRAGEEEFVRAVTAAFDGDVAAQFVQAAQPDQLWRGLERYWRKRAEADAAT